MTGNGGMIEVANLTKLYGSRLAVDDISFSVGQGKIVGFLGPNGAGKTTTMRMLTGYLMPTRGSVRIGGYDMATQSREGRQLIGYLPESVPLYTDMTTRAYLVFLARLRGIDRKRVASRTDEVIQRCHLDEYADTVIAKLSKGYRQRVGLAQALVHDPRVLILDEATVGIDPAQVMQTRALIQEIGKDRTVLLSTHILSEVSAICGEVMIINRGRIVAMDRIDKLSSILKSGESIRLKVQGPPGEVTKRIEVLAGVSSVRFKEPHHYVEFSPGAGPQARINEAIVQEGWTLLALESVDLSLEDIFLQYTTEGRSAKQ